jgi:hypothetical protein
MFLASCSTIKEGFENQKKSSSDEFMVKKKSPLVMPPDYDDLPLPKDNIKTEASEEKIKKLIISNDPALTNTDNSNEINKNFEKSLLDIIKSN